MRNYENLDFRLQIFANIFRVSNKLQSKMDENITDITAKQWLLLASLDYFETPPRLTELAKALDYSHQNTRMLIKKLEEKGYVKTKIDEEDKRAIRIYKMKKSDIWWKNNEDIAYVFIEKMYSDFNDEELFILNKSLYKLFENLEIINEKNS